MSFKEFVYFKVFPFVNSILSLASLKLVTTRTPNRNFDEFFHHLKKVGYVIGTVIDVGVGKGTESLYRGTSGADYILVEPVPDEISKVSRIAKNLNAAFFNVAAGDVDGEIQFNLHNDVTGSSIYKQVEEVNGLDGKSIMVPMRRLDSILKDDLRGYCLLKIDTQGAEINVIRGCKGILQMIDMIICEVSFHQFRHNSPEIAEVVSSLEEIGYVPYEILEGHYRSLDNALAQVDVVFVKKDSVLRKQKAFFTADQAERYLKS